MPSERWREATGGERDTVLADLAMRYRARAHDAIAWRSCNWKRRVTSLAAAKNTRRER
jgi:hypothetical protein